MKTPPIREICHVTSAIHYNSYNIQKVIDEVRLIIEQSIIPTVKKYETEYLWFFNKNEDILNELKDEPNKLCIDLVIYNDKCTYLDFSICSNDDLHELKNHITELMKEYE